MDDIRLTEGLAFLIGAIRGKCYLTNEILSEKKFLALIEKMGCEEMEES